MCKTGDIIVIKDYCRGGVKLSRHSFVILNDVAGEIQGLDYDIICNVMSSFKSKDQKIKKLSYPGNFPISHNDSCIAQGNTDEGYIKSEQLYYFAKDKIDYVVIGSVNTDVFNLLIEFIENLDIEMEHIIDNLKMSRKDTLL